MAIPKRAFFGINTFIHLSVLIVQIIRYSRTDLSKSDDAKWTMNILIRAACVLATIFQMVLLLVFGIFNRNQYFLNLFICCTLIPPVKVGPELDFVLLGVIPFF